MMPGMNDHQRTTGTLPKSNRHRNRERNRATLNQNTEWIRRPHGPPQRSNFFQFDFPVSERQPTKKSTGSKSVKISNNTSNYDYDPYDLSDIDSFNGHIRLHSNTHTREVAEPWLKLTPPMDPRTQSPPNLSAKPTNTDKMPERAQVEGRLNQIREYIKVTSTMMDSLSQSSDPRAQVQHHKLSVMVEDLYDSERKLSKLMEDCQKYWRPNENGELENIEDSREQELRKKVELSQRKLAQLQEHQAHLVGMQLQMRERLNEARQAQQAMLAEDDEENVNITADEDNEDQVNSRPTPSNVEQLERETEALRDKLQQLENKKKHMDHLVQELQAVELSEQVSCSSDSSRITGQRNKTAELEAMKAQLLHLKSLMNEATRARESVDTQSNFEPEHDDDPVNNESANDEIYHIEGSGNGNYTNSFNDMVETNIRSKRSGDPPSVEQIQAVTQELKEQQQLLQAARAELQRLKQAGPGPISQPTSALSMTPPLSVEKKLSNNATSNNDIRFAQDKHRQLEDFMRKDQSQESRINQNGGLEWDSRRGSNSHHSHVSTPGNLWPSPANLVNGSQDHNIDGISAAENILEIGSQPPTENGFGNNFWTMPTMLSNQPPQGTAIGSAEYYRQLLLGSQSQQLQMMSTTIQHCCQLLWSQQREMQSMRAAITQLQTQLRHSQLRTNNNLETLEEQHSNLGRTAQTSAHFSPLDAATLPPSSSLPNLVSLPSTSSSAPAAVIAAPSSCHQQQPLQLNNQVPPGNRANNYWDNFRSYSRQNLLSGTSKSTTDCAVSTSAHAVSSTNTTSGVIVSSHVNNKCNRHQSIENLPQPLSISSSDAHYSLNLQQQQPDSSIFRNNYVSSNDESAQLLHQPTENATEEAAATFRREPRQHDNQSCAKITKKVSEREDLRLILKRCLKALESRTIQIESPLPSSNVSNSSESSDDESEAGIQSNPTLPNVTAGNQPLIADVNGSTSSAQIRNFSPQPPFCFLQDSYIESSINSTNASFDSGNNGDLIQADQNRSELSNNNQVFNNEENANEVDGAYNEKESVAASCSIGQSSANYTPDHSEPSIEELNVEDEQENAEYVMLDRSQNSPTNQWPQESHHQDRKSRSHVIRTVHNSSRAIDHLQK